MCFYSSQDREGEGRILLENTWRRPGDTGEDMELNKKNKDTYILLSWGEDTEYLLNTVKKKKLTPWTQQPSQPPSKDTTQCPE